MSTSRRLLRVALAGAVALAVAPAMAFAAGVTPATSTQTMAPGTAIKLTQAPGAKPSASKGTGEVDYQIKLKGDALVTATDAAGNTATATCSVPPSK